MNNYRIIVRLCTIWLVILSAIVSCKPNTNQQITAASDLNVVQIKSMETLTSYKFLDVRTPAEIMEGKIVNALELNYRDDNFESELLKLDRNDKFIVYCRSGGRSSKTEQLMKKNGFKNVINMLGGYTAWQEK